jgi:hypothetical protein
VVASISSRTASVRLSDVVSISARDAWAVGTVQKSGRTGPEVARWNGRGWRSVSLPAAARRALGAELSYGIASSGSTVWIYSDRGWASTGGGSWQAGRLPVAKRGEASQAGTLLAFSRHDVWLVGQATSGSSVTAFARRYDGRRWHVMPAPPITGFLVGASSPSEICAVNGLYGEADNVTTRVACWNGRAWRELPLPSGLDQQNAIIGSILVRSSHDIWLGGGAPAESGTVGLAAHWNGSFWSVKDLPVVETLGTDVLSLLAPDGHGGLWAEGVCDCGGPAWRLWHYSGHSWSGPSLPSIGGTYEQIGGIAAIPGTKAAWAAGTRGTTTGSEGVILVNGRIP